MTASGANGYQWRKGTTNLANSSNISGATSATLTINPASAADAASDYNVVVTNSCGSVTSNSVALTVNPLPSAAITPMPAQVCASSTGNQASGPAGLSSYAWTITNGTITAGANSQTVTYTAGASGSVMLMLTTTNANTCSNSSSTSISINPLPSTPSIIPSPAQVCASSTGNTASGPAGALSYAWTITNGTITNGANSQTVTYTAGASGNVGLMLTVTNAAGCNASNSTTVPINALPAATITPTQTSVCAGSIGNTASGPTGLSSYAWAITNGTITNGENSQTVTYTAGASGNVTLMLTTMNASNCSNSSSTNVPVNALPGIPTLMPTPTQVCAGSTGNTVSGPTGATSYVWTITNGTITNGANSQMVTYTAGASGNVSLMLTVTNAAGCSTSNSANVPINALPSAPTITPNPLQVCAGSTGNTASGPASASSYAWTITNGTITAGTNSQTVTYTAGAAGTVSLMLTVTNSAGCSASNSTSVLINPLPAATITPSPAEVCAGSTGNQASGPAGLSSYAWTITNGTITNGANSQTVMYTAGASGNVTLMLSATNANSCANSSSTNITINANPVPPSITPVLPFAAPNSTGNQVSGPAGAASYAWTITNGTITNGVNGQTVTYTAGASGNITLQLTVTNASGCSANNSLSLPINAAPQISKAFAPAYTLPNTTTTLTFTITNPAMNAAAFTGVSFTDTFPNAPNLVVANPPNVVFNNCGGGAMLTDVTDGTLNAGDTGVKLNGAMVAVGTPCTVSVSVTPLAQGPFENVSGNVTALNGGMGNTAAAILTTNQAPQITALPLTRKAGSQVITAPIANVSDTEDTANALTALINGGSSVTLNGITVTILSINAGGQVQASLTTDCNATTTTFTLNVTDSVGVTTITPWMVMIEPNLGPALAYGTPQTVVAGQALGVNPALGPIDNGMVTNIVVQSVTPAFGGTVTVNSSGFVSINNATPAGNYTVFIRATDQCGVFTDAAFTLNVSCPPLTVNPVSLPGGQAGFPYNQTLSVSPAGGPYTFAVTSGALPNGLTLTAAGVLSGTPLVTGTFNFRVTATGYGTCSNFRDYTLTIACPAFTSGVLPAGVANSAYSHTLVVSPATGAPFTFTHTGGALPPGLSLTSAGLLSGTPTASGTFNFTVTVTGFGTACTTPVPVSVTIGCPAITLNPATLPNGTQSTPYNQTVAATPAGGGYSYAVMTGALPSGLTLNSATGVISGLPSAAGNHTFSIKATGWNNCAKTQSYNLLITGTCTTISLNPTTLPTGAANTVYPSQTLTATGGTAPYTFSVSSGILPPGLTLSSAGVLTGTPTANGAFSFTVRAAGQGGCTGQRTYVLSITCGTTTLHPASLPNGVKGVTYNQTLSASPAGTYIYSLQLGSLPPGLALNASTGVLSGISNMTGTYNFTIKALAGSCQGTRAYSITIAASAAALAQKADYDGDGRGDFVLWSNTGAWRLLLSGGGNRQTQTQSWGDVGDQSLLGDYDGDGLSDLAVFRPGNGTWYVKRSGNSEYFVKAWGAATDVPTPGDYDGDGKTDLAVFRPSEGNWYVLRSSDQQYEVTAWGAGYAPYNDVAVPGDYDGDGKTDLAVFRRATGMWLVKYSGNGQFLTKQWGVGTDVPVAADYDGDGRTDCAVWRQSVWYIWQSTTASSRIETWGDSTRPFLDQAFPGDYDGDGRADIAVWRAADQTWYVVYSQNGNLMTQLHGQTGDRPVALRH